MSRVQNCGEVNIGKYALVQRLRTITKNANKFESLFLLNCLIVVFEL